MEIRDACTVRRYKSKAGEDKSAWYKIGTAFLHEDGRISMQLAALPVNGEIVLFKPKPKEDQPW